MSTAEDVLRVARSQIGYVEARDGSNKFGQFYGMDKVAWCAEFQWWCFNQAGAAALVPKCAYTPTFYGWFQGRGQAGSSPRPGALVFYDWPDNIPRIQHVGIVEAVLAPGKIQTIEGNTVEGTGNQSNGGGVWRRVRSTNAVVGYGYPAYADPAPSNPVGGGVPLPTLTLGMKNDLRVAALQRFLNAFNWVPALPVLPPTGNYGPMTQNVVRQAQAQMGVTGPDADGSIVGPKTNNALWQRGYRG